MLLVLVIISIILNNIIIYLLLDLLIINKISLPLCEHEEFISLTFSSSSFLILFLVLYYILITICHKLLMLDSILTFYLLILGDQHTYFQILVVTPCSPCLPTVLFLLYCEIHKICTLVNKIKFSRICL